MTEVRISSILGNSQLLDGGAMFGNAPRAMWQKWHEPDALGRIKLQCRALLVETSEKKILCETGIGAYMEPKLRERYGVVETEHQLLTNLAAQHLSHEDIDAVILSHLHFDHAGGLLDIFQASDPALRLLFPNATFVVGEEAFSRSQRPHDRDRASFIPGLAELLLDSGRLELISRNAPSTKVADCFSFFFSDGHTPGQMLTKVQGQQASITFLGDLVPGSTWLHVPLTMGYDRFPELIVDEKKNLYETWDFENGWAFYTHDPEYAASKVVKNPKGKYQAIAPASQLQSYSL